MATVSKEIAEMIIDNNGRYGNDPQVQAVVSYLSALSNNWEFALIYPNEDLNRYAASEYVKQPKFIWTCEKLRSKLIRHVACNMCKRKFTTANVHSPLAWRETQISGLCENCWDKVFAEKED